MSTNRGLLAGVGATAMLMFGISVMLRVGVTVAAKVSDPTRPRYQRIETIVDKRVSYHSQDQGEPSSYHVCLVRTASTATYRTYDTAVMDRLRVGEQARVGCNDNPKNSVPDIVSVESIKSF